MRRRIKNPRDRQGYNLGARYLVFLIVTLAMFAYLLTGVLYLLCLYLWRQAEAGRHVG